MGGIVFYQTQPMNNHQNNFQESSESNTSGGGTLSPSQLIEYRQVKDVNGNIVWVRTYQPPQREIIIPAD